jgi:hypothetical protein
MSKANVFEVIRLDGAFPWTVKHKPTGLYAGSFIYKRNALAAAADYEALVAEHPELATSAPHYSRVVMDAMFAVRKAHADADKAQVNARKERKP